MGSVLGFTGAADLVGEDTPAALAAEAPIYECGFEEPSGVLISGDRVFATGRDSSGEWIEVRSPHDSNDRVWIRAIQLTPDADLALLPVVPCDEPATAIVEVDETTTTTVIDTTSTTLAGTTTTSVAVTTTTTTPPTTTTVPAAPAVGQISSTNNPIWEKYPDNYTYCSAGGPSQPATTQVSAPVTAAAGVDSVVMLWSVGDRSGQVTMTLSSGQYRATLGPFVNNPDVVPYQQSLPITVTVRVTDDLGRTANGNTTVTLMDCTFG